MEFLNYLIKQNEEMALFEFELSKNLEPEDLKRMVLPDPVKDGLATKVLVLSGRGPVWLYAFLTHHFHPCKAIAIYEPRLDKAVIVQSHVSNYKAGDLLTLNF